MLYITLVLCTLCIIVYSTLTRIDEPYPMLVLCGPPGSGKGYFCKLLVEEFPSFFGLGWDNADLLLSPSQDVC